MRKINNKFTIVFFTAGPSIDESMKLSLGTSNIAGPPPFSITLSFTITFGLPSRMVCTRDGIDLGFENSLTGTRGQLSGVSYTVVDPWYMDNSHPPAVRISFYQSQIARAATTYSCTVYVEGRKNITSGYDFDQLGNGTTTATITGE